MFKAFKGLFTPKPQTNNNSKKIKNLSKNNQVKYKFATQLAAQREKSLSAKIGK